MGVLEVPTLIPGFEVELSDTISALAICEDILAIACAEQEIQLVDRISGNVLHVLKGHEGGTNSVAFATGSESPTLISAGEDGKAAIWDVKTGTQLESLEVEGLDADV